MLDYFKLNEVCLNRPIQQNAKVFWAVFWVRLMVEQYSFKKYYTKIDQNIIFYQQNHTGMFLIK